MSLQKNKGAVRRFAHVMRWGQWLQNLPARLTPAPYRLLQIGSAFWQSRALYVAARLDLAGVLGDEDTHTDDIANRVQANADAIFRLMRLLASLGVFEEVAPKVYRNNAVSECLQRDHPQSVRAMVLMHNAPEMTQPWLEQLEHSVRNGTTPFEAVHGSKLYDFMDLNPAFDALFSQAMDSVEALAGDAFTTDFDWMQFARVIDVGGSKGSKSIALLKRHPHLQALVVDRAQVVQMAPAYWADKVAPELLARLRFEAGNLFDTLPPARGNTDVYLLCAVLHSLGDADCMRTLRALRQAIGTTGARAVLMELVVAEANADQASASFDMQMYMGTLGRERSLGEWCALFEQSGFHLEEVVGLRSLGGMLVICA